MDKVKLSLFDIFVYILPGSIILISLDLILNQRKDFIQDIFLIAKTFTLFEVAIILVACYLLGFVNQFISYENFKIVSKLFWKKRMSKNSETSYGKLEDKIVQIRHHSPENFNALYNWFVFRGMSYSLYQSSLFLFIVLTVRAFQTNHCTNQQKLELVVVFISIFMFLRRAITFHEWTHGIINNTIKHIDEFKKK